MSFFILIALAVIQGLTEFLPVSSSGHLVLMYDIFHITMTSKLLSILLHVATLLSVIIFYRKEILILLKHPLCPTNKRIAVTTIITCLLVLVLKPIIDTTFNGDFLFVFFILTAILLYYSDFVSEKYNLMTKTHTSQPSSTNFVRTEDIINIGITYKQAVIIGITQAIACIPGISRSGSTIAVSKICKIKDSATYSFLISIPIIFASLILELFEGGDITNTSLLSLIIALIVCFFVGLLSIKVMTNFVKNNKLGIFSFYLIILSAFLIMNDMIFHLF